MVRAKRSDRGGPGHCLIEAAQCVCYGPMTKATVGGGIPVFTGVFEPLARVTLYLTDENGLGSCFGAA